MIDTNVYLERYPFRRLFGDEPAELLGTLRKNKIAQAWAGSFDALLHRDLAAVNARLAEECRRVSNGELLAMGSVNPAQPDWREDFRRCLVEHRMMGLRLHPDFHGYKLGDPPARELFAFAAERRMLLQIACTIEDDRTQHPALRVTPINLAPLAAIVRDTPELRIQLLNARSVKPDLVRELAATGRVYMDFAMIEGVHGPARLSKDIGSERIVFGSYFPFYYFEAAALKVKESALDAAVLTANAKRLLGERR
ncbi:MAG: amidohydrolase family protein [Bryobacteraceae bacterium]